MCAYKKSVEDFLNGNNYLIEKNDADTGKLYVFLSGRPKYDPISFHYTDYEYDGYDDKWSFPSETIPGNWVEDDEIKLVTLSGVVWHGTKGGELFEVEYDGEGRKLNLHDFIFYMPPQNEYQENQIKGLEHIDNCINQGIKVKKARLVTRVKRWTPYLLWSFAIDCIEHAYSLYKDYFPVIYKEGLLYARAFSKSQCGKGQLELDDILEKWEGKESYSSSKSPLYHRYQLELERAIQRQTESDFSTSYLGKAVLESFSPFNPFTVARHVRTTVRGLQREYRDEYDYPDIIVDYEKEQILLDRIVHALSKKELGWQVEHLGELIGN